LVQKRIQCFRIKDELSIVMNHWMISTPNRYWLQKTIQRLYDSGLFFKWVEWADWSYMLGENLLIETTPLERIPDCIKFDKFGATIIVLVVLSCVALTCEVMEYIVRNRSWFYFKVNNLICKKFFKKLKN